MKYSYRTTGVCSRQIEIELDEQGLIKSVVFVGGCDGNLKGISALVKGKTPKDVASLLEGITCGFKGTSCPDQLAKAMKEIADNKGE